MSTLIVTSSDDVEFAVETDARAIPYELAFARSRTSDELSANSDFVRVSAPTDMTEATRPWRSMDDLPDVSAHTRALVAQNVVSSGQVPTFCVALRRAQARWRTAAVIQGNKP